MTKEQRNKILDALAEERNDYARECTKRIVRENGKVEGADYMFQRLLDILNAEAEAETDKEEDDDKRTD